MPIVLSLVNVTHPVMMDTSGVLDFIGLLS